jgi:hypothetical protein
MKIAQLLHEDTDHDISRCQKRSEINRTVAAMSMADAIEFSAEWDENIPHHPYSAAQFDNDYDDIRKIIKVMAPNAKLRIGGIGQVAAHFGSEGRLEQLHNVLLDVAKLFDPQRQNHKWLWAVNVHSTTNKRL